jgi:hypothetical protein
MKPKKKEREKKRRKGMKTDVRSISVMDPSAALSRTDSDFLKDLRGFAILMVVLAHIGAMWFLLPYSSFIATLAPIFFFASGAGNYYSYSSKQSIYVYFLRRVAGLLVPYYLFCIVVLGFFIVQNNRFPTIDVPSLVSWLVMKPGRDISPFPVIQLWFLRTLAIVLLISPLLFWGLKASRSITVTWMAAILFLSSIQQGGLNSPLLKAIGLDAYRALFYSLFFLAGAIYYSKKHIFSNRVLIFTLTGAIAVSFLLVKLFRQQVSVLYHVEVTDLYFAATSTSILLVFLLTRDLSLRIVKKLPGLSWFLGFLNTQSLSILVLHTLAIYLCENMFGGALSKGSGLVYAAVKATVTLSITFVLSVPFTILSNAVGKRLFPQTR